MIIYEMWKTLKMWTITSQSRRRRLEIAHVCWYLELFCSRWCGTNESSKFSHLSGLIWHFSQIFLNLIKLINYQNIIGLIVSALILSHHATVRGALITCSITCFTNGKGWSDFRVNCREKPRWWLFIICIVQMKTSDNSLCTLYSSGCGWNEYTRVYSSVLMSSNQPLYVFDHCCRHEGFYDINHVRKLTFRLHSVFWW